MLQRGLTMLAFLAATAATPVIAQTIPPEAADQPSAGRREQPDTRKILDSRESTLRIREARELLRKGLPHDAVSKLRGEAFAVSYRLRAIDPRELHVASSVVDYVDGRIGQAYRRADQVHQAQKQGNVNVEAAILKSLVYVNVGVDALSLRWANWVHEVEPENAAAMGILEAFADRKAGTHERLRKIEHPLYPEYTIEVWKGSDTSRQPYVFAFMKGGDFRGALVMESAASEAGEAAGFALKLYDLEAEPLPVGFYETALSEAELEDMAAKYNPQLGSGRYTMMRAELEALSWRRDGVLPFAAWWARYAGGAGNKRTAEYVQGPMETAHAWNWELRDREDISVRDMSLLLLGYVNKDVADAGSLAEAHGPLEHFHFPIMSKEGGYLLSLVVTSEEPVPGERLYFLKKLADGELREEKYYEDLEPPTYEQAAKDVRTLLEEPR